MKPKFEKISSKEYHEMVKFYQLNKDTTNSLFAQERILLNLLSQEKRDLIHQLKSRDEEIIRLNGNVREKETTLSYLYDNLSSSNKKFNNVKKMNHMVLNMISKKMEKYQSKTKPKGKDSESSRHERREKEFSNEIAKLRKRNEEWRKENFQMKRELNEKLSSYEMREKEYVHLINEKSEKINVFQVTIEGCRTRYSDLESELENMKEVKERYRSDKKDLIRRYNNLMTKFRKHKDRHFKEAVKMEKLKETVSYMKENIEELNVENRSLRRQLDRMKKQMEEKKKRYHSQAHRFRMSGGGDDDLVKIQGGSPRKNVEVVKNHVRKLDVHRDEIDDEDEGEEEFLDEDDGEFLKDEDEEEEEKRRINRKKYAENNMEAIQTPTEVKSKITKKLKGRKEYLEKKINKALNQTRRNGSGKKKYRRKKKQNNSLSKRRGRRKKDEKIKKDKNDAVIGVVVKVSPKKGRKNIPTAEDSPPKKVDPQLIIPMNDKDLNISKDFFLGEKSVTPNNLKSMREVNEVNEDIDQMKITEENKGINEYNEIFFDNAFEYDKEVNEVEEEINDNIDEMNENVLVATPNNDNSEEIMIEEEKREMMGSRGESEDRLDRMLFSPSTPPIFSKFLPEIYDGKTKNEIMLNEFVGKELPPPKDDSILLSCSTILPPINNPLQPFKQFLTTDDIDPRVSIITKNNDLIVRSYDNKNGDNKFRRRGSHILSKYLSPEVVAESRSYQRFVSSKSAKSKLYNTKNNEFRRVEARKKRMMKGRVCRGNPRKIKSSEEKKSDRFRFKLGMRVKRERVDMFGRKVIN